MNTHLTDLLWIAGASQGFLLTFFLLLKNDRRLNFPLIIFIFLTAVQLVFQYLYKTKTIVYYPHLIYITESLNVLCGVLIFMYFRNIYHAKIVIRKYDILLFLPFICYFLYYFPFYLQSAEEKISALSVFYKATITWDENLGEWAFEMLANIPFLHASWILLKKYQIKIKNQFADIETISYESARNLLGIILLLYVLELITIILALIKTEWAETSNLLAYILNVFIVYLIGYDALVRQKPQNPLNFLPQTEELSFLHLATENQIISGTPKYKKNSLSEEKSNEIAAKIKKCMEEDALYRNSNLKLIDLAETIQENANNVSQVINEIFKQNFYDFVNNYRIEEAKKRLKSTSYDHYNIEAIGLEVGFNAKSTFYTAFKKNTGMTPIQYKKT